MRKKSGKVLSLIVVLFLTSACMQLMEASPTSNPTNTQAPPPSTNTPEPSVEPPIDTPEPLTVTYQPENTPLPEGVIFRDDFEGSLQPGWTWENENPEKWSFTGDGWLEIVGEPRSLLGDQNQNNLLWYPLPDGEFEIEVHLMTNPFSNFHQATIYIYEDPENYIALNRGYCDICDPGGDGFYMEYKIDNAVGAYQAGTSADDVYLKLVNEENIISGYYATSFNQWERLGRFGNFFQFSQVGIGVTNVGSEEAVIGQFDYFQILSP